MKRQKNNIEVIDLTARTTTNSVQQQRGTNRTTVKPLPHLPSVVVSIILKKLDETCDLLSCRLVNTIWYGHASEVLRGKENVKIRFTTFSLRQKTLHLITPSGFLNEDMTLSSLNSCFNKAIKLDCLDQFPCTRFEFRSANLDAAHVQKFFALFGPHVTRLDLTYQCSSRNDKDEGVLTTLTQLLGQIPNIEHLNIDDYTLPSYNRKAKRAYQIIFPLFLDDGSRLRLSRLKRLDCFQKEIVEGILQATTNHLEDFRGLDPTFASKLNMFVSTDKVHTIQELAVELSLTNIGFYEDLNTRLQPKLKSLSFGISPFKLSNDSRNNDVNLLRRIGSLVTKMLETNKETLESITKIFPLGTLPQNSVKVPTCQKLTKLCISNSPFTGGRNDTNMFPPGLDFLDTFPTLKSVTMDLQPNGPRVNATRFWLTFFPFNLQHINFFTVDSLTLYCTYRPPITDELIWMFPNLRHLTLTGFRDLAISVVCDSVWKHLKHLESLCLLDVAISAPINFFPCLDSALTGFDVATSKALLDSGDEKIEFLNGTKVQDLRRNLSILELKGLKRCTIQLLGWGAGSTANTTRPILSRVSGLYAFQIMPELQVSVIARVTSTESKLVAQTELNSIAPFVHSVSVMFKPE